MHCLELLDGVDGRHTLVSIREVLLCRQRHSWSQAVGRSILQPRKQVLCCHQTWTAAVLLITIHAKQGSTKREPRQTNIEHYSWVASTVQVQCYKKVIYTAKKLLFNHAVVSYPSCRQAEETIVMSNLSPNQTLQLTTSLRESLQLHFR